MKANSYACTHKPSCIMTKWNNLTIEHGRRCISIHIASQNNSETSFRHSQLSTKLRDLRCSSSVVGYRLKQEIHQVCERCAKPGHVAARRTAIMPAFDNAPPIHSQAIKGDMWFILNAWGGSPPLPEPHGPTITSDAGNASTDWAVITYASSDESRVCDDLIEEITIPSAYLHSAFTVLSDSSTGDVWIAESGASCQMTHNNSNM